MAINVISYDLKSDIETSSVPNNNKVSASDLNEIKQVVNQNANLVGDGDNLIGASNIIEYLMNRTKADVLWTNSDTTSDFAGQTITLDESLDDYDMYEILYKQSTGNERILTTGKIPVGNGTFLGMITSSPTFRPTSVTVSGSTISFEDAKVMISVGTTQVYNNLLIPMYVIGYKTGVFN